ncbi:somatostatin receptor type 2-like [Apostichopus japonicus]|uniref:somatostatin receptor type 2-like n=1 Tax=Stichopus japonicus TaxID=307972 RepID=UPI003AB8EEDB
MTTEGYTQGWLSTYPGMAGDTSAETSVVEILIKVTPFIVGVICILGLVFNGLIILHIMLWTKVKSLANTFILNLALADLFFMITFPFLGYQLASQWIFGELLCRILIPYDTMTQFTVVFFLVVMSLDRYLAFCQPIKSMRFRTLTHGRIISIVVWATAIVATLPVWLFSRHFCMEFPVGNNVTVTRCYCTAGVQPVDEGTTDHSGNNGAWFTIYTLLLDFCIPLVIICGCYLLILWNLIRNPLKEMSSTSRRASRRITFLVICIVVVFIVCFLPFFIVQFYVSGLKETEEKHTVAYVISWFLMYSHSVINPVVYTMIGVNFRQNLLNFFRSFWKPKASAQNGADKTSSIRLCTSRSSVRYAPGTENLRRGNGCQYSGMKQLDMRSTEFSGISKYEESL